jgi:aldehyde dehydrogenase (NAD(P)+)
VEPAEFLADATAFCNERLWGTLAAELIVHPLVDDEPEGMREMELAVERLRYGVIGINQWPAVAYALGTVPWGPHPSSTARDRQSGSGFFHDIQAHGLAGIEKVVVRGPLRTWLRPAYFGDHSGGRAVSEGLVGLAAQSGMVKAMAIGRALLRGASRW